MGNTDEEEEFGEPDYARFRAGSRKAWPRSGSCWNSPA